MLNFRLRKILLKVLCLCVAFNMTGPTSADTMTPSSETYIAEKNGANIVLNGVRHGTGMAEPSATLRAYFERSTVLMTEFDFTDQRRSLEASKQLRHGESLAVNKFLNAEDMKIIHLAWLKKLGVKAQMTAETLGELHACGIGMYLLPSTKSENIVNTSAQKSSWENIFLSEARRKGKAIIELEPNGSMRTCAEMPADQVRSFVLDAAKLGLDDNARAAYLRYIEMSGRSYDNGDGDTGYAQMMKALDFTGNYKSAFLNYMGIRNRAMVDVIEQQHGKLSASDYGFIMVGALHLNGETGILSLLRAKGFRISKLRG